MAYGEIKVDTVISSTGTVALTDLTSEVATQSAFGYMSAADKTKLDGLFTSNVDVSGNGTFTGYVASGDINGAYVALNGASGECSYYDGSAYNWKLDSSGNVTAAGKGDFGVDTTTFKKGVRCNPETEGTSLVAVYGTGSSSNPAFQIYDGNTFTDVFRVYHDGVVTSKSVDVTQTASGYTYIGRKADGVATFYVEDNGSASFGSGTVTLAQNTGIAIEDGALSVYQATSTTTAKPFSISSDVGGTETEKAFIRADGSASFGGSTQFSGQMVVDTSTNQFFRYNGTSTIPYLSMSTSDTQNGYIQFTTTDTYVWNSRSDRGLRWGSGDLEYYDGTYHEIYHSGNLTNNNQLSNGAGYVTSSGSVNYATTAGSADSIDGVSFVNTGNNSAVNADTVASNCNAYYQSGVTNFSGNAGDGHLYGGVYSGDWQHQIAGDYRSGQIAIRGKNGGTWGSWYKVWSENNDGSGSGLDADKWDGNEFSSYLNQDVKSTAQPTFNEIYNDGWFRTNNSGEGMYNQATGAHFYSDGSQVWNLTGNSNNASVSLKFRGTHNGDIEAWLYADGAGHYGWLNTAGSWKIRSYLIDGYSPNIYFEENNDETWTGNTGNDQGKIEYHANRFYIVAGANSTEVCKFRRAGTDVCTITNSGDVTAAGNVTAYSDIKLKENIEVIPNALDKVSALRGVTYNRKDLEDNPRQSGVIAQEVEEVLPEVVQTDEDGIKSVAYGNLVGLLIESIKELKAEVETLKAERN